MSEELLYDLTGETDSPLDAGELRTLATRIETQPWHPSLELAASLTNAAALALERAETPADANGVRKGLLAFQRLFQLRGARLIEANLLVGQRLRTEWELGRLLADSRLRGGDRKSNSSDVSLIPSPLVTSLRWCSSGLCRRSGPKRRWSRESAGGAAGRGGRTGAQG
jgi:hypothetical protein